MAGSLARQLFEPFVTVGWLRERRTSTMGGGHRVLEVTPAGRQHLLSLLGLE